MSKETGYADKVEVKGNKRVVKAIDALSKFGKITFSRDEVFKSSHYTIHFFKPTKEYRNLYNFGNEILVLSCNDGMGDFRSRTKDFIDYILVTKEEFHNRLDRISCFLLDDNRELIEIVNNDRKDNPDSRLIIPFRLQELQNGISEDDFNNRLRDFLYVRDLFGIASPLNNETMFFGKDRTDLITDLYGKYLQGEPGGLFGLRRIGKTSVLNLLKNRIRRSNGVAIYFDCSRYHHSRWNAFLKQIIDRIIQEYEYNGEDTDEICLPKDFIVDNGDPEGYSEENAINSFEKDISKIYEAMGNTRILLIFDEIESIGYNTSLSDNWGEGNDAVFFWEALRSISQMDNRFFTYLIAGVNPMCVEMATINGNANPVFGSFSPIYMKLFDDEDVNYMVSSIGGHLGLFFESQVCSKLLEDYGGHPFLTRQVCSKINRNYLEKKIKRPVKVSIYEYKMYSDDFQHDMTNVIEQILGVLESYYPQEYDLLKRLALNGRESFKKENTEGDKSIQHLLGYCLIEKHEGEYFIRINSIEKYLQNKFIYDQSLTSQSDIRARINLRRDQIEVKLRNLIWTNMKFKYGKKTHEKICEIAKKTTNDENQQMRLKKTAGPQCMEELYLSQLKNIIDKNWKDYQQIFYDKTKFDLYYDILNRSRNVSSHAKAVTDEEDFEYSMAFKFFEECLEETL